MAIKMARSFILLCLISVAFAETPPVPSADVARLIKKLADDDSKVIMEARQKLIDLGPSISPVVFDQLFKVSWEIKPRLIEVLSQAGMDYTLVKLHKGNPAERQFAALVYELNFGFAGHESDADPQTCDESVSALRAALKSEDKNLRALAALALVDEFRPKRLIRYWSEIVPTMISSIDTSITIDHRHREDPSEAVMFGIVYQLDAFIGDIPEFASIQESLLSKVPIAPAGDDGVWMEHRKMSEFIAGNREQLDALRGRWSDWWSRHAKQTPTEIGNLIIERDIKMMDQHSLMGSAASSSFTFWTDESFITKAQAEAWWNANKANYKGPPLGPD
ncbi:MAG: hypothetical protein HY287_08235 [Planctomycetes bacterium]|nr:hypothetical protein [Planctomycetota bacterium]MBI3834302.1 hypothetical protein [Planctomycetota bacterium]